MSTRVQVILGEEEREAFRSRAERDGLSLSAWLREAGREKLTAQEPAKRITSLEELRAFFATCDAREKGREPDWEEHLAVIEGSIGAGAGDS